MKRLNRLLPLIIVLLFTIVVDAGAQHGQAEVSGGWWLKGMVTDGHGEPLVGATVREARTFKGTVSDIDGKFSIQVRKGQILLFDYVGMKQQKLQVNTDKFVKIVMESSDNSLEEVVVTGYHQVNSRIFVGSAAKVSTKDFAFSPQADFSRLLEGKAPGLNISSASSAFGSAPKMNIRGGGSINGSVQPLWVVDGAVLEDFASLDTEQLLSGDAITLISSNIAGLNPADIESIEVLKDASATSLYGARGMNGVIIVTTKSGERGKGLSLSYNLTLSKRFKPSYRQFDMMDSRETMEVYREMENKGYFTMNEALYARRGGVFTQWYERITDFDGTGFGLTNTEAEKEGFLDRAAGYNTDWFDRIYTDALTQNHSLSLAYGGEKSTTYASLSYYHDPGETVADRTRRATLNLKNSLYLSEKVKTVIGVQASFRDQYAPGTFPRIRNLEAGAYKRDFDINPFFYALNTPRTLRPYNEEGAYEYYRNDWAPFNIMEEYQQNRMQIKMNEFRFFLQGNWNPVSELHVSALLNARHAVTHLMHHIGERSNVIGAHRADGNGVFRRDNIYLYRDPVSGTARVALPMGGIYDKTTRSLQSYMARLSGDYGHSFGEHHLKVFSFAEMKMSDNDIDQFKGYGIAFDKANSVSASPDIFRKTIGEGQEYFGLQHTYDRGIVFSGSLTYSYRNRYVLNLVGNYEGSNLSGTSDRVRWLPTWNIGGRWNLSEEEFFSRASKVCNRLALRASYGLVAKMNPQAINSVSVFDSKVTFRPDVQSREYAIYLKHLENRDLTWEKMYELNVGLDAGLWNNRVSATLDVYRRNSFDLIDLVRTAGIGGEYQKWANFGDMTTTGFDWSLQTVNVKGKHFSWSTVFNFSYYKQRITRLVNTPSTFDLVSGTGRGNLEGFPRGALYSFEFAGLNDRGLPSFYWGDLPLESDELSRLSGANFYDTRYNRSYLVYNGPVDPYITTGLSNVIQFKNWELAVFLSGQIGNKVRLAPTFDPEYGDLNVFTTRYRERWLTKGDENRTHIPVIPGTDLIGLVGRQHIERAYNAYNYSDVNVVDGSFIRMKSISLTYRIPVKVCERLSLKSASVNVQLQNPFLIYADRKLNGRDPEFVSSGGVATPIQRTYSLSINTTF